VLVEPGDIVIGDDDGVVVVPRRIAPEIVAAASAFLEGERGFLAMLSSSTSPSVPRNSSRSTATGSSDTSRMAPPRSREEALDERRLDPPSTERGELSQLRQAELGQQLYAAAYPELREPGRA
jgi:hypothetical protein